MCILTESKYCYCVSHTIPQFLTSRPFQGCHLFSHHSSFSLVRYCSSQFCSLLYIDHYCRFRYTILQNKRIRRCGVLPSPPIIFERLKLPQQIIYRRKGNLSESPNHFKYRENILISRFYEQFS